jgi:hypothetical protein
MDKGSSQMEIKTKTAIDSASTLGAALLCIGASASSQASVLINEIDYDQPGSDSAEFIELYNSAVTPLVLDGYTLALINGSSGDAYHSFDLSGLQIAANGYLVICNDTGAVANCSIDAASGSWMQNGGPDGDAAALLQGETILDSVAYEGTGNFLGPYAEGNSFTVADSGSIVMSIARLPNGIDTDSNADDFASGCLTPGGSNIAGTGDCSTPINPVPVPAAAWLFGSGLIGLIGIGRRKSRA